ncbi:uracil-DNA glycosylase [Niabella insulamsoli]|uniref:uracil-DNA glycosylase n=1 Tax=Niabella insulamsoli TaxID=3144874 RepID=UPI0031FBD8D1
MNVQIEPSWKAKLKSEFEKPYFAHIVEHLKTEKQLHKIIYPPGQMIFNAFNSTPFDKVKLMILGQDPYHGPGQAHGLCFSVQKGVPPPPSLVNIFKELQSDIGLPRPSSGDLSKWAAEGVFLLNASLTVRAAEPMSHARIGWAQFTDAVIKTIAEEKQHIVFLLWGKFAQEKAAFIDESKHLVLKAAHPSPLSAHNGFLGCRHFSKANEYLIEKGISPIDWQLD